MECHYEFSDDRQCDNMDSCFIYNLITYVLKEYGLEALTQGIEKTREVALTEKLEHGLVQSGIKGDELKEQKATLIFWEKESRLISPFCEHIGQAVIAMSHLNRRYILEAIITDFSRTVYPHGYFSQFLVIHAFLIELIIYMGFRNMFTFAAEVWDFHGKLYHEVLEEKFLERGGWRELKKRCRPFWIAYKNAKTGINFSRPEWVYYSGAYEGMNPDHFPIVTFEAYMDPGHPDDYVPAYPFPENLPPDQLFRMVCNPVYCRFFCLIHSPPEEYVHKPSDPVEDYKKVMPVPVFPRYPEVNHPPLGFIHRDTMSEAYAGKLRVIKKFTEEMLAKIYEQLQEK